MIKKISKLLFLILLNSFVSGLAQEGNGVVIEISKEKTVINGKKYFLHTVKKGENLYRISKAYNITQKEIVISNPEAISGIVKEGQILKIPVDSVTSQSIQQIESDNFIYHITEEHQTVFSITQKFNITQEVLNKYNPELEFSPLQVGQVVRVPKSTNVSASAETFQPIENYTEHKVKKKETKYSISREYNITVDELITANPVLNSEDLKTGSVIRIPRKSEAKFNTKELVERGDSIIRSKKTEVPLVSVINRPYTGELKIGLLLPFSIDENETRARLDSAAAANAASKDPHKTAPIKTNPTELLPRTIYALEFYQGFLLAVDSMKKTGISVKVHVYDTEREVAKVSKILTKPEMQDMDFIVGPFFQEALEKVNEFSLKYQIKVISPVLKENPGLVKNPYFFQFIPTDKISIDALLNYISTIPKKKIFLMESNDLQDKETVQLFKDRLNIYFPDNYKIVTSSNIQNFSQYYAESEDNIVFVPSINEAYIFTLFSKLNLDTKIHSIKVLGLPNCARFKNIDQLYFHNIEFHYFSPFFIEYTDPSIKQFISQYKKKFSFEPQGFTKDGYNFAMLGFDLGNYFIRTLSQDNIDSSFNNTYIQPLHMKIRFAQDSVSGNFINQEVQIMKFTKDFYLKKAN